MHCRAPSSSSRSTRSNAITYSKIIRKLFFIAIVIDRLYFFSVNIMFSIQLRTRGNIVSLQLLFTMFSTVGAMFYICIIRRVLVTYIHRMAAHLDWWPALTERAHSSHPAAAKRKNREIFPPANSVYHLCIVCENHLLVVICAANRDEKQ